MRTVVRWGLLVVMAPCPLQILAAQERTTVGGYGEVHYTNPTGPKTPPVVNLARFVVYVGHSFDDRLAFRSELEVEDAKIEGGRAGGEVSLEQAYLDYRLADWIALRADGLSAGEGIREGRQEGRQASFANPSVTGRLEWARPGVKIGGSFWYGGTADTNAAVGTGTFGAPVALFSADARYERGPFALRGVVANISVSDAQAINAAYGQSVGSRIAGGYLEGAYNLLWLFAR